MEHVDHLNAKSWLGTLVVHDVDLQNAWNAGCDAAVKVLEASQLPKESFNYTTIFVGTVDTLWPWGGNSYPGVSTDVDCSLIIKEGDDNKMIGDSADTVPIDEHALVTADDTAMMISVSGRSPSWMR